MAKINLFPGYRVKYLQETDEIELQLMSSQDNTEGQGDASNDYSRHLSSPSQSFHSNDEVIIQNPNLLNRSIVIELNSAHSEKEDGFEIAEEGDDDHFHGVLNSGHPKLSIKKVKPSLLNKMLKKKMVRLGRKDIEKVRWESNIELQVGSNFKRVPQNKGAAESGEGARPQQS
mmetsp:Transcript_13280/g.22539  ORF Transcript_13280/g.22539 Transcript_13280/m.22539 type:complete len:173 (+) Transcript_13280:805-1323(+)